MNTVSRARAGASHRTISAVVEWKWWHIPGRKSHVRYGTSLCLGQSSRQRNTFGAPAVQD